MAKFLVLMNAEYLHGLFPEREHVKSISDIITKQTSIDTTKPFTKEVIGDIEQQINSVLENKYQTIKVSDYTNVDMSGRIELRFFGGENYHKQADLIKRELFRAIFILEIAYTNLHERQYYRELYDLVFSSDVRILKRVMSDPMSIKDIKNPSKKVQLAAVTQNGYAIEHIDNPSETVQLEAVKENGSAILYIENPSEVVQLEAVKQDGYVIEYIENPSEVVQLEAVKQNGLAIKFIENPSEVVQLEAVKQDGIGYAIKYIDNPSEVVQVEAVKRTRYAIRNIENPTDKVKALHKELWD